MDGDPDPPIPSLADAGYLLFPPLVLAGSLVLLRARARGVPRRLWVDGVTAALGVAALSAAIVFETVLDSVEGKPLAVATGLAYPLLDLVLLGLAVGALASTGWRLDRTWMLLAAGVSTFWLADSLYLVRTAEGVVRVRRLVRRRLVGRPRADRRRRVAARARRGRGARSRSACA